MFADDTQIEVSSDNVNLISNSLNEELVNVSNQDECKQTEPKFL